ncbi:MAG TPA: anti-sigma factor [Candidatus Dormibacteraeota bacterium]|nr:anti-sigma factor [Candidatus Dormibacteraeota bacterium]
MGCDYTRAALHGYLDGELDAARSAEFERHLENCRECANTLGAEESLRSSLQRSGLYEQAPVSLRKKIRADLYAAAPSPAAQRIPAWRWLAVAASILLVAGISWYAWPRPHTNTTSATFTAAEMIDAHIRSLQPGHLTDVASTDQHTVKPWFTGKLDFAPPVKDYADEGFPLIGGRLDVLAGRNVAAIVYTRRKHIINVFVLPTKEPDTPIHPPGLRQGYQWLHWRRQGMEYCAVSDVSLSDLNELAQLIYQ